MTKNDAIGTLDSLLRSGELGDYRLRDDEPHERWRRQAALALRQLESDGRLRLADTEGGTIQRHLSAVATGPVASGLIEHPGRTLLVGELIRNLAEPGRINQGLKASCAATCVEIELATREPAEYARLLTGLVAPEGRIALRSGEVLRRDEETLSWSASEARRSPVSRLIQVAFMEFAYPDLDYRNLVDGQFAGEQDKGSGVELEPFDRLLEAVTGERWDTLSERQSRMAKMFAAMGLAAEGLPELEHDALTIIERATLAGESVFATLQLSGGQNPTDPSGPASHVAFAHKVRVLSVDREAGRVLYDDPMDPNHPWFEGVPSRVEDRFGQCSVTTEDFLQVATELSYRAELWEGPPKDDGPSEEVVQS